MTKTVEKDIFINATPERVFQTLTEKAELERWFTKKAEVDLRAGGALRFEWAPDVIEVGKFLVLEPPQRLSYTWEAIAPSPLTVTFALAAENAGTRLHLIMTGIGEGEAWENFYPTFDHGWDVHLEHLTTWLETGVSETPGPAGNLGRSGNE